jgi:hypothetical protein
MLGMNEVRANGWVIVGRQGDRHYSAYLFIMHLITFIHSFIPFIHLFPNMIGMNEVGANGWVIVGRQGDRHYSAYDLYVVSDEEFRRTYVVDFLQVRSATQCSRDAMSCCALRSATQCSRDAMSCCALRSATQCGETPFRVAFAISCCASARTHISL